MHSDISGLVFSDSQAAWNFAFMGLLYRGIAEVILKGIQFHWSGTLSMRWLQMLNQNRQLNRWISAVSHRRVEV